MILIAGGDGFIGKHVAALLDGLDPNLYEIADLKSGTNVCDVDGSKYDVIVLLAANLGHDMDMFQDNLAIYRWAARQSAHIIYTSSAAVYGNSIVPHNENEATIAPTIYGRSKLIGEQIISQASKHRTILRLSNVYGNGDGNGAIDIFKRGGNKIYGDGSDVRDYVPVGVVAEAIKRIVLHPSHYDCDIYNISSNTPMTTNEAYMRFGNEGLAAEYVPARGFDVKYSVLNNRKAIKAGLIDAD